MRRPRADSVRNRDRLLQAASEVFRTRGGQATLEGVAREAGVGIGTLYRHFPTREALFEAVYRREADQLAELSERLAREEEPVAALRAWMHANIRMIATKQGMLTALALAVDKSSEVYTYSYSRLTGAIGLLLGRAVAAGRIRDDVKADDILLTLVGMSLVRSQPGWEEDVIRLADMFLDGLTRGGTARD
ncbi:TetR/AcrR family transcriptional regulator [Afifella sp. IM 167]|uniref:TetR/AcrR family transcriptional regulator n=1 Tax=Afifella sp. IM 167 TaxID=2033586 RepID=UPI001CCB5A44|nr:TetR/AcrR family transcriptional regulator [Afifella sp. IM 167]